MRFPLFLHTSRTHRQERLGYFAKDVDLETRTVTPTLNKMKLSVGITTATLALLPALAFAAETA